MALKKCKECDHEVSSKAVKCPNCGAPLKRKGMGCGALILFGFLIAMFVGFIGSIIDDDKPKKTKSTSTSKQAPKKPTEIVSNSGWDASVYQVERYLKDNLKDPKSYEAIEWSKVQKVNLSTHKYIVRCKYVST